MYDIHAWYPSFKKCEPSYWEDGARIIMENRLYRIAVEDNEWSLAVKLLQKGDGELEGLQRGWFDKYMFAIRKSLLKYLPDIGTYTGPWTSGRITKEEFALEVIESRIAKAEYELSFAPQFDCVIVNDDLETAKAEALKVIKKFLEA